MDAGLWFGLQAGIGAAFFLAAAKTHGRQIRLERELRGFFDVDFRRATNPPAVETIWRVDRITFWWGFATAAVAAIVYVSLARPMGFWWPPSLAAAGAGATAGVGAVALAFWVFPLVFTVNTLASARRFRREVATRPGANGPDWARLAQRGTWAWLTAVAILGLAVAAAAGL